MGATIEEGSCTLACSRQYHKRARSHTISGHVIALPEFARVFPHSPVAVAAFEWLRSSVLPEVSG